MIRRLAILVFALISTVDHEVCFGIERNDPRSLQRILFVGNSYTYFNNLPAVLEELGNSVSAESVEAKMIVAPGATLRELWASGEALKAIREGGWTYVVLQEQSTLGEPLEHSEAHDINDPSEFYDSVRQFDREIRKAGARTALYLTWSRQDAPQNQTKLTQAYTRIARELQATLVPVGPAWQASVRENPGIALYQVDKSHPTSAGTYLAACVFYGALLSRDPSGLPNQVIVAPVDIEGRIFAAGKHGVASSVVRGAEIDLLPEAAHLLQRVAWNELSEQQGQSTASDPFAEGNDFIVHGNYLAALRVMSKGGSHEEEAARQQIKSWYLNAVAEYDEGQQSFNDSFHGAHATAERLSEKDKRAIRATTIVPAEDAVVQAVKEHQVVILNEAHHQPEHRALGAHLIPRLADAGLKFVGIETSLQEPLDLAAKTGHINTDSDLFSWDPQRAALLQAIVNAGLTPIAIDMRPDERSLEHLNEAESLALRESTMARHLEEAVKANPQAKFLVWVGFSHALKAPQGDAKWMAARFREDTKIEPYSIYQLSDTGDNALNDPIYRWAVTAIGSGFKSPMSIQLPDGASSDEAQKRPDWNPIYARMVRWGVDAVILHPHRRLGSAFKRPEWLHPANETSIAGTIACGRRACGGYLVQAMPAGDTDVASTRVPLDQVVTGENGKYTLRVPAGTYQLRVRALDILDRTDRTAAVTPSEDFLAHRQVIRNVPVGVRQ